MADAGTKDSGPKFKVYSTRWVVLALFGLCSFTNAAVWIEFAPISSLAEQYYETSKFGVNCFSMMFMAMYLPGTLMSMYLTDRFGVKACVVTGGVLTTACTLIRWLATFLDDKPHLNFGIALVGTFLGAVAQPCFTNAPALIAGSWFPPAEREIATTIAAMLNPLGNAGGAVVPPIIVNKPHHIRRLTLYSFLWTAAVTALTAAFFHDKPPTPPSQSADSRNFLRSQSLRSLKRAKIVASGRNLSADSNIDDMSSAEKLWLEGRGLLRDSNFLILFFGFSVGLGVFNALLTVLNQIVEPCGYTTDQAGTFGGVLIGAGLVGAAITGPMMESTKAYVQMLKGGILFCCLGVTFFLANLRRHQFTLLTVSFGVMGFAMLPMLPLVLENTVETIYPVPEDTGAAFLLGGGQFFGIIFIFVLGALIPDSCHTVFTPSGIFLFSVLVAAALSLFFFKKNYRRQAAERGEHLAVAGDEENDMTAKLLMSVITDEGIDDDEVTNPAAGGLGMAPHHG